MISCLYCDYSPGAMKNLDVPQHEYEPVLIVFREGTLVDYVCGPCCVSESRTDPLLGLSLRLTVPGVTLISAEDAAQSNAEEYWDREWERRWDA